MEGLLVEVIQQHRQQAGFILAFAQAARQGQEALHAFGLQPVAAAQARFQQGNDALRDDPLDILIAGQRPLLQVDGKALADAQQTRSVRRTLTSVMAVPLAPARPVRPARWM